MVFSSKIMNLNIKNAVGYLTFKRLLEYPFLTHAFSTRLGGVSENEFKSMNLSFKSNDKNENVKMNQKLFCEAVEIDESTLVKPELSHGKNIGVAGKLNCGTGGDSKSNFPATDALITNESGVTIVTSHADCHPIFIVDPVKKAIGLAHAGWRGTVANIAGETVKKMGAEYGCRAEDLICCIGPGISLDYFVVGDDVAEEFKKINLFNDSSVIHNRQDKFYIDLYQANKKLLISSGVMEQNIVISDICTYSSSDLLFSHRATKGKRGAMIAMMSIK